MKTQKEIEEELCFNEAILKKLIDAANSKPGFEELETVINDIFAYRTRIKALKWVLGLS